MGKTEVETKPVLRGKIPHLETIVREMEKGFGKAVEMKVS